VDAGLDQAAPATLGVISVPELVTALQAKDFLLIGVHIPYAGQIPGTDANIAYNDVPAIASYIGSNLDQKVVVYCMSNSMSTAAGQDLVDLGYRAVRYLDGGMGAWTAAKHPLDP
jgi:rhodanese-related sulfurtransferase